jgi:hypothetical protein
LLPSESKPMPNSAALRLGFLALAMSKVSGE